MIMVSFSLSLSLCKKLILSLHVLTIFFILGPSCVHIFFVLIRMQVGWIYMNETKHVVNFDITK